jgi:hypothetical protein
MTVAAFFLGLRRGAAGVAAPFSGTRTRIGERQPYEKRRTRMPAVLGSYVRILSYMGKFARKMFGN